MEIFLQPEAWIALLTLTFLEIVLGIDNIIFISIVSNKLPEYPVTTRSNFELDAGIGFVHPYADGDLMVNRVDGTTAHHF
tara:strand:- start:144 stop:383 length:240 start_codon:yes stop_codon:yes gene_type:complete